MCVDSEDFGAVADIAVSSPARGLNNVAAMPMRGSVNFSGGEFAITGACQKAVLRNNTLIMWSGSYIAASVIVKNINVAGADGQKLVDLHKIIDESGLSHSEKESVNIIYILLVACQKNTQWWRCYRREDLGRPLLYQGSGVWDFMENTTADSFDYMSLQNRAILNLWTEQFSDNSYNYTYGGWFEFVSVSEDLRLIKEPYAIKSWVVNEGKVHLDHPLVFSWYAGDALCIANCRSIFSDNPKIEIHGIEDMLGKSKLEEVPSLLWQPRMTFHVVEHAQKERTMIMVEHGTSQSIAVEHQSEGKLFFSFKKAALDEFLSDEFWARSPDKINKTIW